MKNEKIYSKLENNFHDEVREKLLFLKKKGHILVRINEGLEIWGYNARLNDFKPTMSVKQCVDYLISECPNYYDIFMTIEDYVSIIVDTLPLVSGNEIDDFRKYNEAIANIKDDKILKKDLATLNKELKNHNRPVLTNSPESVQEQIQALINDGIVFCRYSDGSILKKSGLFKYDTNREKWEKISSTYIANLLNSVFSSEFQEKSIEWKIKQYYDGVLESQIPYQWNRNKEYQEHIKNFKNPKLDGSEWV